MTEGVDLSRYDSADPTDTSAVDDPRAQFVILNIEDPGCDNKAHHAHDVGKDWALYSWLYPQQGAQSATRLEGKAEQLAGQGLPLPPKGGFIDYEANGVGPGDLTAARLAAAGLSVPMGPYTYLYLLNSQAGLAAEWWAWPGGRWLAYYPDPNDGARKDWARGDADQWGAMLWQFSSSNGTRDRSLVTNDAEWAAWGSGSSPTPQHPLEDDVFYRVFTANDATVPWFLTWMHPWLGVRVRGPALTGDDVKRLAGEALFTIPVLFAAGGGPYTIPNAALQAMPFAPAIPAGGGGGGTWPGTLHVEGTFAGKATG